MRTKRVFSSFSTNDLGKTKDFYIKTLGLEVEKDKDMDILKLKLPGGGEVMIYPKDNHEPASFTVLNLLVENIDESVDELTKKQVGFEKYDGFGQDNKGIARSSDTNPGPAIAWFKDSAGNILAIIEDKS